MKALQYIMNTAIKNYTLWTVFSLNNSIHIQDEGHQEVDENKI